MNRITEEVGMKSNIISRQKLMDNLIVHVSLKYKTPKKVELPDGRVYKFFTRQVLGGKICFHLFDSEKCQKHNKHHICVEAQVWKKEYVNGTNTLYVDLFPTTMEQTHTIRKCLDRSKLPEILPDSEIVFPFNKGALIFSRLKTK